MKSFSIKNRTYKNKGFSLLEALIGFMVLSVGMLGIASLQAMSLKAGKTSVYTSVAMMRTDSIVESMRANASALLKYAHPITTVGSAAPTATCTGSVTCTPEQLAKDDLALWQDSLKAGLPGSVQTHIVYNAATAPSKMAEVDINIAWRERKKTGSGGADIKIYTAKVNICTEAPC